MEEKGGMCLDINILRCEEAAAILPLRLRKRVLALRDEQKAAVEEFRLRVGRPLSVLLPEGELMLETCVEAADLETLCDLATEFSRYAAAETLRDGYLSVRGGFRVGLCGTAVMKDGSNTNLRHFSGASVRVAREKQGIGTLLAPQLFENERFCSTLIISPPGGGKTTLLRDLVRCLSDGTNGVKPSRLSLVDERGEVAVMYRGAAQMDVGRQTDVMDACPKALAIPMMLRAMNPQIIAVDEITLEEDIRAMQMAAGSGVGLLATVHGSDLAELERKPLYRKLLRQQVFQRAIVIRCVDRERSYRVEALGG